MSHSSVLRLIDKVGEGHDRLVEKWRDDLTSQLKIPQTEPVTNLLALGVHNTTIMYTHRLACKYVYLMFLNHQTAKKVTLTLVQTIVCQN